MSVKPRDWHDDAVSLHDQEYTCRQIADELGVPKSTVHDYLLKVALPSDATEGGPNILMFDIETSPNLAYVWQCYDTNVIPDFLLEPGDVMCWAAKWLGNDAVIVESAENDPDDERIMKELWKLFDAADIVVAHNGRAFDEKHCRARWVSYGMEPPSPYRSVDTLKLARGLFRFPMNKLDCLGKYLDVGSKLEHGGSTKLWLKCLQGDPKAWDMMREYNAQDVYLLEAVYLKLRAWDRRPPNVSLMFTDDVLRCVCCGAASPTKLRKKAYTNSQAYPAYRCKSCGKVMRGRKREDLGKETLSSIQ